MSVHLHDHAEWTDQLDPISRELLAHWPELSAHAERWCAAQAAQPDLATALVQFCRNSL